MKERDEMIEIVRKECEGIIQEANCVITNKGHGTKTTSKLNRIQNQPEYLSDDEVDIRATIHKLDSALIDQKGKKKDRKSYL